MARWSAFEPVLLNLADSEDYALRVAYNGPGVPSSGGPRLREAAKRVRLMIDDIERQLDANSAARREAGEGS